MLTGILDSVKRDRARFARNIEYLREMAREDVVDDRTEVAESQYVKETIEDYKEAAEMVNQLPSDDSKEEAAEIQRIMEATDDITFDEMIGIKE